jgi:hypothetical protein
MFRRPVRELGSSELGSSELGSSELVMVKFIILRLSISGRPRKILKLCSIKIVGLR